MLAQRQPSFEDRVIAHWPSVPAPKMIGTEERSRNRGILYGLVGERGMCREGFARASLERIPETMQA